MSLEDLIPVLKKIETLSGTSRVQMLNALYNTLDALGRMDPLLCSKVMMVQTLSEPERTKQLVDIAEKLIMEKQFANAAYVVHMIK